MQAARRTPLTGAAAAPRQPRRVRVLIGVAVLVLAADVIAKVIVVATLSARPPVRLNSAAATNSIARLISPAAPSATTTSSCWNLSSSRRSASSRHGTRDFVSAECR